MRELINEFSWSWSRHRTFGECLRRYWLNHYGFWGGWNQNASPDTREIYIQKKLNTRPQWIGTTVHEAARWALDQISRGQPPQLERVTERFLRAARLQIESSYRKEYRLSPKRHPGFVEHYYGLDVSASDWEDALAEIERQIGNLFANKVFTRLSRVPGRIVEFERLVQIPVSDVPVWVSLDVLVQDEAGGYVIIDWKTGKAQDKATIAGQLGVYGVYVQQTFLKPGGQESVFGDANIKTMHVNLRTNEHAWWPIEKEHLLEATATIERSAAQMRGKLRDPDNNIAVKEDFPMLEEGSPRCQYCPFRKTCDR